MTTMHNTCEIAEIKEMLQELKKERGVLIKRLGEIGSELDKIGSDIVECYEALDILEEREGVL